MLQIKFVKGKDMETLENNVNSFLASLSSDAIKDIKTDIEGKVATIQYEFKEAWEGCLCCDCRHWDDGNDVESLIGLCQECGGRKRFNNRACSHFKDVRGVEK